MVKVTCKSDLQREVLPWLARLPHSAGGARSQQVSVSIAAVGNVVLVVPITHKADTMIPNFLTTYLGIISNIFTL
jgi:hypothetical protein